MHYARGFVSTLVLTCLAETTAFAFLPPTVLVRKVGDKELAGKTIEQAVWDRPVTIPRFEYYVNDYLPTQQTQVRMAYDDTNLYVAYKCFENRMSKLSTKQTMRDTNIWKDDSVGIDLDTNLDRATFFRLRASASGVLFDAAFDKPGLRQGNMSWDPDWKVNITKDEDSWSAFMVIPFKSFGVAAPKEGTVWGANLGRRSIPSREQSPWAQCRPAIQDIPAWGNFVFSGSDAPAVCIEPYPLNRNDEFFPCRDRAGGNVGRAATKIAVPGKHPMTVRLFNPTDQPMPLRLDVLIDDKVRSEHRTTAKPGETEWKLDFDFPDEGLHELKFAIHDAGNRLIYRTPHELVLVAAHAARLAGYRELVKSIDAVSPAAKSRKTEIEARLAEIDALREAAMGDLDKWKQLKGPLDAASLDIQQLRCVQMDADRRGYIVGTETALRKIMRDEMFEGKFGQPAMISLARNEYESVQVCVLAYDKPLSSVDVSVSELRSADGNVIPGDRIKLNLVEWVDCKPARYAADLYGWTPDPLMPMAPFDVEKGALRPVWITIHAPDSIPAGQYTGSVRVKPKNAPETSVPLTVRVWDFAMPNRMHARTAFAFFKNEFGAWYGKGLSREKLLEWYDFLLQHRLSPTDIYSSVPVPGIEDIAFCVERGMNAFNLHNYGRGRNAAKRAEVAEMIQKYEAYLKEKGWWDIAYVYGFDELGEDLFPSLRETYGEIKAKFPGLPRMTTIAPQPELKGYVDIWVPLTSNYLREVAEEYRRDGDKVWWYVCCHPFHPWPNYFVDYNAVDPRILWWMSWKEKCPGILYYAVNLWEHNHTIKDGKASDDWEKAVIEGKRWPEIKWNTHTCGTFNGDGHLVYPGPNQDPIASIRLVSIRDGIEDFEYLHILDSLARSAEKSSGADTSLIARAKELVSVRDDVVKSPWEYTTDPEKVLNARAEIAEMIEKLSRQSRN